MNTPTLIRKISDLTIRPYGDNINRQMILCEPTPEMISDAIRAGRLEQRNYQVDLEALKAEWFASSQDSANFFANWQRVVTEYHAGRIAHFVVNGWNYPILINANDEVTDGTHRIKAAIFKNMVEVEVAFQL